MADPLKHIFDVTQVIFLAGHCAENEFEGAVDPLKHRFLDLAKIAFLDGQKEENRYSGRGDPL
jgi:hypothetical protein